MKRWLSISCPFRLGRLRYRQISCRSGRPPSATPRRKRPRRLDAPIRPTSGYSGNGARPKEFLPCPPRPRRWRPIWRTELSSAARPPTLSRRTAAIRYAHKFGVLADSTDAEAVKATLRGIRRTIGSAKVRKTPAVAGRIKVMVSRCAETLAGKRDRALLLLGFAGAFRRSSSSRWTWRILRRPPKACAYRSPAPRRTKKAKAPPLRLSAELRPARYRRLGIGLTPPTLRTVRSSGQSIRLARSAAVA